MLISIDGSSLGNLELLYGVALIYNGKFDEPRELLEEAWKNDDTVGKIARTISQYVDIYGD